MHGGKCPEGRLCSDHSSDADALNLAAEYRELTGYFTENIIVTPHMKEMSRLTGIQIEEMKENPVRTAREFADQYGVVCVLKDAATVIAGRDGKTFVNGSGTPAMAKGGSGDVLTGVIAGPRSAGTGGVTRRPLGVYVTMVSPVRPLRNTLESTEC